MLADMDMTVTWDGVWVLSPEVAIAIVPAVSVSVLRVRLSTTISISAPVSQSTAVSITIPSWSIVAAVVSASISGTISAGSSICTITGVPTASSQMNGQLSLSCCQDDGEEEDEEETLVVHDERMCECGSRG